MDWGCGWWGQACLSLLGCGPVQVRSRFMLMGKARLIAEAGRPGPPPRVLQARIERGEPMPEPDLNNSRRGASEEARAVVKFLCDVLAEELFVEVQQFMSRAEAGDDDE